MMMLHLTPLAKVKVWFRSANTFFTSSGMTCRDVKDAPLVEVMASHLTLEAYVPRGSRADYGLLGICFEPDRGNLVRIAVPYAETVGLPWLDGLATQVDDVRLGMPKEFAKPILDAAAGFAADQFPAGTLKVVEAAYGIIGSSEHFFRRIVACALSLMLDDREREEKRMAGFLKEGLMGSGEILPRS